MDIEEQIKVRAVLHCPKCDAIVTEAADSWIRFISAIFPDQLDVVHLIAIGGADFISCPVCKELIEKPTLALCFIRPLNRGLLYVPPEVDRIIPGDTLSRLVQQSWRAKGYNVSELEMFSESLIFRRKVCHYIARLVFPPLNGYGIACVRNLGPKWVFDNQEHLNLNFFSGLWLLGQPGLPVNFHQQAWEENAPAPSADECVHSGVQSVPNAERMTHDDAHRMMGERLHQLLTLRLVVLAGNLADSRRVNELPGPVEELIPRQAISDDVVAAFGATFSGSGSVGSDNVSLQYALHAVLASMCQLAEKANPQVNRWTELYVLFEHLARTDPGIPAGLRATQEFAAKTVSVRVLWDINAAWMNKIQTEQLSPSERDWAASALKTISDLVYRLGFDEQWAEYVEERLALRLEQYSDEELDKALDDFAEWFRSEPEMPYILFRPLQRELAKRDQDRLRKFVQRVRQESLEAGRTTEAIWVTVRASEQWNNLGMTSAAHEEVRACIDALQAAGSWPPADAHDLSMLLTEEANCLRYRGEFVLALERYEQIRAALPANLTIRDVRVNERNRAIILRDLGRVGESMVILNSLLEHGGEREKIIILHSIAVCHLIAGRHPDAGDCLTRALEKVAHLKLPASDVELKLLLTAATLALRQENYQSGFECARKAREVASALGNPWQQAIAAGLMVWAMLHLPREREKSLPIIEELLDLIRKADAAPPDRAPNASTILTLRQLLALLFWEAGDPERAERVLEEALPLHRWDYLNQIWIHWMTLAQLASQQGKAALARQRLEKAYRIVIRETERVAPSDDPVSLMQDKDTLQFMLTREFLDAYRTGSGGTGDLRLAADFQASVLLSRQLAIAGRRSANLPGPLEGQEPLTSQDSDELEFALETLAHPRANGAAVLQFFRTRKEIHLLVTTLPSRNETATSAQNKAYTELATWVASYTATADLATEAWHRLARCSPARVQDPLVGFAEWEAFAVPLRAAVEALVPPGLHLCLIPGALSGMPLQYAFGTDHPLSYAPSLFAAGALRRRHMALASGGGAWRPRNLHDFVVWKAGEREENVIEFKQAAAALQAGIEPFECAYRASVGVEATQQALFEALSDSDCVRLSCHGRGDSRDLRFDLLVACEGWLPPGHPTVLARQLGERFLVSWQELSMLPSASPLVFSAACASGLTASLRGGERIGLERSLLRAGTVAYVAPQWPVPISVIQPLVNRVIVEYLRAPERTLADVVFKVTTAAIAEGIPLRVARSLVVHGDWL